MSKETGVIVLGIWVFILPFLGIPGSWRTVLLALTGVGLAVLGFLMRSQALSDGSSRHASSASFTDSSYTPQHSSPHETNASEEIR